MKSTHEPDSKEIQMLEHFVADARKPLWRHVLAFGPGLLFFWVCSGLLFWLPESFGLAKLLKLPALLLLLTTLALTIHIAMQIVVRRRLVALLSRLSPAQATQLFSPGSEAPTFPADHASPR